MSNKEVESRKDACGQEVKIGDLVTYVQPKYHMLVEGYVIKFTSQGFSMSADAGGKYVCNRRADQVVKLPSELRLKRLLGV